MRTGTTLTVTVCLPAREARWALQMADYMASHAENERARVESVRLGNRLREGLEPEYARKRQLKREQKRKYVATHREQYLAKCREYARAKRARERARKERATCATSTSTTAPTGSAAGAAAPSANAASPGTPARRSAAA